MKLLLETLICANIGVLAACVGESAPEREGLPAAAQHAQGAEQNPASASEPSVALAVLMDSIRTVSGEYSRSGSGRWNFTGNRALLARAYNFGDEAVDSLVACLGNEREGNIILNGRRLAIAFGCYEALSRTAYPTEFEDGAGDWPGALEPDATLEEVRAAAAAWRDVAKKRRYRRA